MSRFFVHMQHDMHNAVCSTNAEIVMFCLEQLCSHMQAAPRRPNWADIDVPPMSRLLVLLEGQA